MRNVKCSDCDEYRNEWCEKVVDSPHPDMIRDCPYWHERKDLVEVIRCRDCVYYDSPHVENDGVRFEYKDMPKDAFDELGTGLVNVNYGINVGGRCIRDYNSSYVDDKRVYVPESNYCGRAERREE